MLRLDSCKTGIEANLERLAWCHRSVCRSDPDSDRVLDGRGDCDRCEFDDDAHCGTRYIIDYAVRLIFAGPKRERGCGWG